MAKFSASTKWPGLFASAATAAMLAFPVAAAETAIPDFSGMWGRNAFNFEPVPGSPAPVTNLKRLPNGAGDPNALVGDYNNPILTPEAAAIVKEKGQISLTGMDFPDPSNHCAPYAPPFTFAMQLGVQVLQAKDRITLIYNQDDQVRHVRLNASHPTRVKPSAMGDSVGHYEGDTLVVDTVGIDTLPFATIDRYGTPHSKALHVVERYRLLDYAAATEAAERHQKQDGPAGLGGNVTVDPDYRGKGLQLQFTVEDPKFFTMPWSANITYRRIRGAWTEQICAENSFEYYSGKATAIPTAKKSDF
ncbi:MAG TPA: hypothetical protein VNH44_01095 [Micropepsaceae bacterium]|nr:hypothetical protein [Micropepsaceae bacterium]